MPRTASNFPFSRFFRRQVLNSIVTLLSHPLFDLDRTFRLHRDFLRVAVQSVVAIYLQFNSKIGHIVVMVFD